MSRLAFIRFMAVTAVLGLLVTSTVIALANHDQDPDVADIAVNFPATYASCVDAETFDNVSITNVGSRYLNGELIVQYVLGDASRQTIEIITIDQVGDWFGTVTYPPLSEWPVMSNGTAEIHVDIQIGVYESPGGTRLGGIGPGHDWDVFCTNQPTQTPTPPPTATPTPTATVPDEFEGCTPGYWRQDQHYDSWVNYSPSDLFDTVFGVNDTNDLNLGEAVQANGGGENALMRHAVAALLNATSSVDYPYSEAEVIAMVQQAFATGDFEGVKNLFEAANEAGCPLN